MWVRTKAWFGAVPSGFEWRIVIAWLAIAVAMIVVAMAAGGIDVAPARALVGSIALLALLGNLLTLDARRVSRRRARLVADRAGHILSAVADRDIDSADPVVDIERRVEAIDAAIDPIRHRLVRRHRGTGLPTREPLLAAMRADLTDRRHGTLCIFEFCDFDRLSAFDLDIADEAIMLLAGRISRMVGDHALVAQIDRARIGAWFRAGDREVIRSEIDAICYALSETITIDDQDILPEIASGRASAPDDGEGADQLMMAAIATLAGIQRRIDHGGGAAAPVAWRARDAFALEQDLHHAITRGEFELAYQPLVDAGASRICGAEALIRWHHPQRGLIMPSQFIPLVEASGMAHDIGMWALNTACRQARAWQRGGLAGLSVAVNLSACQLEQDDLPVMIARTMSRHGLGAGMLEVELTETVAAGDTLRARKLFEGLRARGVSIAIDDFGTGYSSLSYLRQLSFDKLKIDREFVTDVDSRPASQAICQSVIALGRGLGIHVLAEGVERAEEFDWLTQHGCTLFQGFYFGRPMAPRDFSALVAGGTIADLISVASPRGLQARIQKGMRV
jgi:EAL domain-containing protein (putative c-di-GMP-specific phosphodiesterase class I)/GGDEF domain-containing protein